MKKVLRYESNTDYWDRRWAQTDRDQNRFLDMTIYPIRYAVSVMTDKKSHALELGVGLGRVLKHFHYDGYRIMGIEKSDVAVTRLRTEDPSLDVRQGDVVRLPFGDEEFDVILAFGLFHNLEDGLEQAIGETARCLKRGGRFCISMRPHNLEMIVNEWYWRWNNRRHRHEPRRFHKWLVRPKEFLDLLANKGLRTTEISRARNVSLLYRIPLLRARSATEAERRARGYRLNVAGRIIDSMLVTLFPSQFCNVLVFTGHK